MSESGVSRRSLWASGLAGASFAAAMGQEPEFWTLLATAEALRRKKISSVELTDLCLRRIGRLQPALNAFITVEEESARAQARAWDGRRARGAASGPLGGIPIALKDNIDTAGVRTTAASAVFRERVPTETAEVAKRLGAAGAVSLGKLNLDEMAFEGTGTTSCFGPVRNPWNLQRITGGSSAGSGAALAAGLCYGSVGTDDGGSVRIPGAFCGVVGLKTTYGRVSTRGIVPSAYSMDTVGPMARSVEDAALLLQSIAGYDPQDGITAQQPVPDYLRALTAPVSSLRVGVARPYFFDVLHPDVATAIGRAIAEIGGMVREVREVRLPRLEAAERGSYDVELYHYQRPFFEKTPELYHPWSRRQMLELQKVETVPYIETLQRVREIRREICKTFAEVDLVVLPTKREPAPFLSETLEEIHRRPPSNTSAFNHYGTPAITVPCGVSGEGLPIGLQIAGPAWGEPSVLALAYRFQQATEWHNGRPSLAHLG